MVIFQFEFEYFRHLSIFIHLKMKMLRLSKVLIHLKMKMLRLSNVLIHLKMKMLRPGKAKDVFIHFGPLPWTDYVNNGYIIGNVETSTPSHMVIRPPMVMCVLLVELVNSDH